jgi:(p)ppGpp synthase/HD superfamily hydrolase
VHGYSDRINHAFAFAAKHRRSPRPQGAGLVHLAHPANVAVILSRFGCDEATVVAGILHHVLENALPPARPELEQKIGAKFGPVVLAVACDAVEPGLAGERSWRSTKSEYLTHLATAEPRALDICVADELHGCGSAISALGRYGREYRHSLVRASADDTLWWYRSLLEQLSERADWKRPEMLGELRRLSTELVRTLRTADTDL